LFSDFEPAVDPDKVRPFVYEDGQTMAMHFDISAIQSRMRRDEPFRLDLDYTRTMMGFLLWHPQPRSILAIGLGGGSLPKYCHRHLQHADITVVEINPHVIELRDVFAVPADDHRFHVVCGDGAEFVASARRHYDVILVDGFTYDGQPKQLCTRAFYEACRMALTEAGVMVVNLQAEAPDCDSLTNRIALAFGGNVLAVPADGGSNRIVLAGSSRGLRAFATEVEGRWEALAAVHQQTLRLSIGRFKRALEPLLRTRDA
jgi:spermidine synthase